MTEAPRGEAIRRRASCRCIRRRHAR